MTNHVWDIYGIANTLPEPIYLRHAAMLQNCRMVTRPVLVCRLQGPSIAQGIQDDLKIHAEA